VNISGGAGGLMSWLLNLLDISPTVCRTVRTDKIFFPGCPVPTIISGVEF
jgi:hypothetical protein